MWNKILSWFWMKPNEVLHVRLAERAMSFIDRKEHSFP